METTTADAAPIAEDSGAGAGLVGQISTEEVLSQAVVMGTEMDPKDTEQVKGSEGEVAEETVKEPAIEPPASDSMITEPCQPKYKHSKIARLDVDEKIERDSEDIVGEAADSTAEDGVDASSVSAQPATIEVSEQVPTEEELAQNLAETTLENVEKDTEMTVEEVGDEEGQNVGEGQSEEPEAAATGPCYWDYVFARDAVPFCFASTSEKEYRCEFLKGCKWAPDGSCLLTNSDDSVLRVFNFPENVSHVQDWKTVTKDEVGVDTSWSSALKIKEGGLVYDYSWYPFASSMDPSTTVFLTTSKDTPIHLWDATYGNLRATYLAYNDADEPIASYSVAFDATGEKIYAGYDKSIRIFSISRPGRQCVHRKLNTSPFPELRQNGLISCFAFNPAWANVYACGSYRKTIGLYMEDGTPIYVLNKHVGGVTNLVFSRDGTKLYSGARSDSRLICWDLRNLGTEYKIYTREVKTQQRIYFELTTNDRYLISGGTDGIVRIWDTTEENAEPHFICASPDCVNGVSINPYVPVLATATGQRKLYEVAEDDSDDESFFTAKTKHRSCDVKLWKV